MNVHLQDERRVTEKAADWLVALDEDTDRHERNFAAWVGESARNIEEFLFVSCIRAELGAFLRERPYDVGALLAGVRAEEDINVVAIGAGRMDAAVPPRVSRWWLAAACLAVLLIALGGATIHARWHDYTTDVGEQRTLGLPDGSVVHMNIQSHVKVAFSSASREVQLVAGEALFRVAPDPARPFRVRAGGALIQAVGTQFNVYCRSGQAGGATVSVIEGSVRISRSDSVPDPGAGALDAGQQARVSAEGRITGQAGVDVAAVAGWRQRRLVFVDERLEDVATEFNRYNPAPRIEVRDAAAGNTLLSGVFDADDPESLLLFVTGISGLSLEKLHDRIIIRSVGTG